jgi:uncharacterized protein (UPF0332 family)
MGSETDVIYQVKAQECLAGAASELANGRYNNCANRCYYACFQAAIAALLRENIPSPRDAGWGHAFVQAQFAGILIQRRKRYPSSLRDTLTQNLATRQRADYEDQRITEAQADRAYRRAALFVRTLDRQGGEG